MGSGNEYYVSIMEKSFEVLNKVCFRNELRCPRLGTGDPRVCLGGDYAGIYLYPGEVPFLGWHTIFVNLEAIQQMAESFGSEEAAIIDTMLHEMVHYWCYVNKVQDVEENGFHNNLFMAAAESHGLECAYGPSGYAQTEMGILTWARIMDEWPEVEDF